jgi:anti-sigma regulatory factor (Ser/Thr protein kinase)
MASRVVDGGRGDGSGRAAAMERRFDREDLSALRAAVAAYAGNLGVPPDRVARLVIIASELAGNAVRHGGGTGWLRLSYADGCLCCEVRDSGPGLADPAGAGTSLPPVGASAGRGLWLVRRVARDVRITSTPSGTTVSATVPLD